MAAQPPNVHRAARDMSAALRPAYNLLADAFDALHAELGDTAQHEQNPNSCYCWCDRWGHVGACTGVADTLAAVTVHGTQVQMPMCPMCARHLPRRGVRR